MCCNCKINCCESLIYVRISCMVKTLKEDTFYRMGITYIQVVFSLQLMGVEVVYGCSNTRIIELGTIQQYQSQSFTMVIFLALTHFVPLASFYTPCNYQKTRAFLMFTGGIERDRWHEMS